MKQTFLLELGYLAIARGLWDIGLRSTYLKMEAVRNHKDPIIRDKAEAAFTGRVYYLVRTGVIEIERKPKTKRRAA